MEVPITQFRRDIFALMNRAKQGEQVSVTYKGERFLIIPEASPTTRFDRITSMQIINPEYPGGLEQADADWKAEFEEIWNKKWSDR
jgi:prevent-host-death family protein